MQARAAADAQRFAEVVDLNMSRSGLPRAYQVGERGIDNARDETAKTLIRGVIDGDVRGAYLYGDAGEGKTTLACAALAALIRTGMTGRYVNSAQLLADIQATYGDAATVDRNDLVLPLMQSDVLVIDDLGKEKGSEHAAGVIYQILDGRYARLTSKSRRVLIIASNFDPITAAGRFREPTLVQPILRRMSELTVAYHMARVPSEANS